MTFKSKTKFLNSRAGAPFRRPRYRRESGQTLVELGLMLPFLLLLSIGVIEMGRYAHIGILVGSAARAGVAYGAQSHNTAATGHLPEITAAARSDFSNNGQDPTLLNVSMAWTCACDNSGTITPLADCINDVCPIGQNEAISLSVTATGTFTALFTYPGIPSSITVSRTATLRIGT
jgi:Flp pilus assembly protein TadG